MLSAACSHEETVGTETAEPSEAPVFVSFEPGQAKAGDVLTITGAYFGTDPSRITVLINSTPVQIVSVSDNAISVIVPEECGSGEVRIGIRRGTEGELKLYETTFETLFTYTVESNVSTFAGRSGLTGQHYFGPYLTSCFYAPSQLVRDKEDNFYLAEWARGIRLLSNGETSWMLPMYGGGTPEQNQGGIATDAYSYDFRAIAFSNDCSRLWILVNRPQSRGAYLGYALKSDGYGLWYADSSDDQPDWSNRGIWYCFSQKQAYATWNKVSDPSPLYFQKRELVNTGDIGSIGLKGIWTGDYFEFVFPVENIPAGAVVSFEAPFYGRQQPVYFRLHLSFPL